MSATEVSFRNYVFGAASDGERLTIQHEVFKPDFVKAIEQVLDEYGLALQLEQAKKSGEKLRIIDIGCAEGLYLNDVAEILEQRGLRKAADFFGIDRNMHAILSAEKLSEVTRPYLNFYVHDATEPLENCLGLRQNGRAEFNFIYSTAVIEHLPGAQKVVEGLYKALRPGGVIFLRDSILEEGNHGWISPHPMIRPFVFQFCHMISRLNNGIQVSTEQASWLRELGAQAIQTKTIHYEIGGNTKAGMQSLRNAIMKVRNGGPAIISQGLMTQDAFDELMSTLFREIGPHSSGQETWVETIARKG